jgi:predicted RNA-binding protein YlqC (UPF0109 family)
VTVTTAGAANADVAKAEVKIDNLESFMIYQLRDIKNEEKVISKSGRVWRPIKKE